MCPIKRLILCGLFILAVLVAVPEPEFRATAKTITQTHKVAGGIKPTVSHKKAQKPSRYQIDALSVNTADWRCISFYESTNDYGAPRGGKWQLQGTATLKWLQQVLGITLPPQDYSPAIQDQAALALYRYGLKVWPTQPFHAWRADWRVCHLT